MKESHEIPSHKPFIGEKCGLFQQQRTDTTTNSSEPLPKVIDIDQISMNGNDLDEAIPIPMNDNDQDEAVPMFNLKRSEQ